MSDVATIISRSPTHTHTKRASMERVYFWVIQVQEGRTSLSFYSLPPNGSLSSRQSSPLRSQSQILHIPPFLPLPPPQPQISPPPVPPPISRRIQGIGDGIFVGGYDARAAGREDGGGTGRSIQRAHREDEHECFVH